MGNLQNQLPKIPQNAKTIIIVLGQCSLPNGQPHPWLIERVNTAYSLLAQYKLDILTTYFIVSGSDVSNRQYGIIDSKFKHQTEAWWMHKLLLQCQSKNNYPSLEAQSFNHHVIKEDNANTTVQNFYYALKMIKGSNLGGKIKDIFIITSDFHMKRAKFVFDTMFFRQKEQIIDDGKIFKYEQKVHFVQSKSKWQNQNDRKKKFQKQDRLYNQSWLIQDTKSTASRLWDECMSRQN